MLVMLSRPVASFVAAVACCLVLSSAPLAAQQLLPQPQDSPAASVEQTIGITEVSVDYHRPAVKGRAIWGVLVPFGEVWRAGANENTTITFSTPVKVEGKDLAAGTYGLHMLPTASTWTAIFSRNASSWGSFSYSEKEDALRVTVTPVEAPATEWLAYEFGDFSADAATLSLRWEKLSVPIHLAVQTDQLVVDYARNAYLRGQAGFSWQGPNSAAAYCLRHKLNLDEALTWSDRSLGMTQNYTNLSVKAGLLEALGHTAEAAPLRQQAVAVATEPELNTLGYQYLQSKQMEKALELFKANVAAHPESWNTHDSLAEACQMSGDTKTAIEHYRKALELVKDDTNKARIAGTLEQLGAM